MIKKVTLTVMSLFTIFINSNSQAIQKFDSIITYEKAKYLNADLPKILSINTKYPKEDIMNNKQGDVVMSFIIDEKGKLDRLGTESFPNISLLSSSKLAINSLDGEWKPALINNTPADRKYLLVFRFRIYLNSRPYDFKGQARKLFEKQKFEKALKLYDKGIKDNQYDFELFEFRAKVKETLGDIDGAKADQIISFKLKDEVMLIVDIIAIGVTRTEKIRTEIIKVQQ